MKYWAITYLDLKVKFTCKFLTSLNSMVTVSVLEFPVILCRTTPISGWVLFLLTFTINSQTVLQGQSVQKKAKKAKKKIDICSFLLFVYIFNSLFSVFTKQLVKSLQEMPKLQCFWFLLYDIVTLLCYVCLNIWFSTCQC